MTTRLLGFILLALFSTATRAGPLRIMAIGDSITQGGRVAVKEYTYRWPLARMLADDGICFDFVGSRSGGLEPGARWPHEWDSDHEGYYGGTTAFVRDQLAAHLPKLAPPDVALIHLGTNDGAADTVASLRQIVALLRKSNPRVSVLIAQIPAPMVRGALLHFDVWRLASEVSMESSNVVAVDQYSDWNVREDTFDGVHPNLKGQRKIAERWLDAMRPYVNGATCAQ